jgi:hypothetical protein
MGIARLMGYSSSFLELTVQSLPVSLRGEHPLIAATAVVVIATRLIPAAIGTPQQWEEEREHARASRTPFLHRYLDFLLILPTAYAYQQLRARGSLALLVQNNATDLYRDPLLVLVPALFILTASLLAVRLLPLLARLLDWLAAAVPWVAPHLALRQLCRRSESYINPLLLIIVCLALGIYTLSMAASLDRWLGSHVLPWGRWHSPHEMQASGGEAWGWRNGRKPLWALPFLNTWNCPAWPDSHRVRIPTEALIGTSRFGCASRGDRLTFPRVTWFRRSAAERASTLMNRLASTLR